MRDRRLHEQRVVDQTLGTVDEQEDESEQRRLLEDSDLDALAFTHGPHEAEHHDGTAPTTREATSRRFRLIPGKHCRFSAKRAGSV